jgi:gluconolactonase
MLCEVASGAVRPYPTRRNGGSFKGINDLAFDSRGNLYFTDQGQTGMHDPTGRL